VNETIVPWASASETRGSVDSDVMTSPLGDAAGAAASLRLTFQNFIKNANK
jgi:hypothetical protein